MKRLICLALGLACMLTGCSVRDQPKVVWDKDGCAYTLITYASTTPTNPDAWGQTWSANVKVIRNTDLDKTTCVRNPRGE